jgi:hypothetical protein
MVKEDEEKHTCSHCKRRGHEEHSVGSCIQNYDQRSFRIKGNKILLHQLDRIWDQIQEMNLRSWK